MRVYFLLRILRALRNCLPYDFDVQAEVVVSDQIAETCHLFPRNVYLRTRRVGDTLRKLADNLQLHDDSTLRHTVFREILIRHGGDELANLSKSIEHEPEQYCIVLHKQPAGLCI